MLTPWDPVSIRAASMRFRIGLVATCLLVATAGWAQEDAPATPRARRAAPAATARPAPENPQSAADRALLRQLADAQRSLGEEMQQLRDRFDTLHGEISSQNDQADGLDQEVKALRDEVKGLYVESSTTKQQIDGLKDDISAVNSNVSAFRTYAGFFIAVMILLLAVIFVLTVRR